MNPEIINIKVTARCFTVGITKVLRFKNSGQDYYASAGRKTREDMNRIKTGMN